MKKSNYVLRQTVAFLMIGILLSSFSTDVALAGLNISVNGNGFDSNNSTSLSITQQTTVTQQNTTAITNIVDNEANTGGNTVAYNVGDTAIHTGEIESSAEISNIGSINTATTDCQTCYLGDISATIADNGAGSKTNFGLTATQEVNVVQEADTTIKNIVKADLNTGNNLAKKNVGDTAIKTGDIVANVSYHTNAGNNTYQRSTNPSNWNINVDIYGNGAYSHTHVGLALNNSTKIDQKNSVALYNKTKIDANTGGNECAKNVGDCTIATGKIAIGTKIGNVAGINIISDGIGNTVIPTPTPPIDNGGDGGTLPDKETTPSDEEDKSLISTIRDILFPPAEAATDETVLGAVQLPMTGLGELPFVSWSEALIGLFLITLGGYIRHWINRLQKRYISV